MNIPDCLVEGFDAAELEAFAKQAQNPSPEFAEEIFPGKPEGYIEVIKLLSQYAAVKSAAIKHRLKGRIQFALTEENRAEFIYTTLPQWAKW